MNVSKMSFQEIFNIIYEGFKQQKFARARNRNGTCLYLSLKNTRCAVGHLFTDLNTDEIDRLEGLSVLDTPVYKTLGLTSSFHETTKFLHKLQHLHDTGYGELKGSLEQFAKENNLTIPGKQ
jgi:hypothetical protein